MRAGGLQSSAGFAYFVVDLVLSVEDELEPDDGLLEVSLEDEDGVLLEPAPAAPPEVLEGEELDDEDAPPLAGLLVVSLEELELLEGEDALPEGELVEPDIDALPEGELDGELVVPLADDEDEPDGEVVAPEGEVLLDEEAPGARSLLRLQPVTTAVPSARVTASAKVETLMRPPW